MKIISWRRVVVARMVCPVCHEPARANAPRRWVPAYGPRPAWSHVDGEPLCPVIGATGYRPARRPCTVTALRPIQHAQGPRVAPHSTRQRGGRSHRAS